MFLDEAAASGGADRLFADDEKYMGWVMNVSRLWAWRPESQEALFALLDEVGAGLSFRERGILITACASTIGDAYCSLAWGGKLATKAGAATAAAVLDGTDDGLTARESAMARWARTMTTDPNATTPADIDELRSAGFDDGDIFAITLFVALRAAFSTVNDALGSRPDAELRSYAPPEVLDRVDFGRPIDDDDGPS